jgi:hypothetical protein
MNCIGKKTGSRDWESRIGKKLKTPYQLVLADNWCWRDWVVMADYRLANKACGLGESLLTLMTHWEAGRQVIRGRSLQRVAG